MPTVLQAPVNVPLKDQNGNITTAWMLWFESVDARITEVASGGGSSGDVIGGDNTGFEIAATGDIYINGIRLQLPTHEGQIGYTLGTDLTWVSPDFLAATPSGVIRPMLDETIPEGWLILDDGTIGNAASGASNRANADCSILYSGIWNGVSDTYAPVSGGRGASAAADFAAGKKIQLGFLCGRAPKIMAGTGTLGVTNGADSVTMSQYQLPEHHHTFEAFHQGGGAVQDGILVEAAHIKVFETDYTYDSSYDTYITKVPANWPIQEEGGTDAQPVLQPTTYFKYMIKL